MIPPTLIPDAILRREEKEIEGNEVNLCEWLYTLRPGSTSCLCVAFV